MRARRSPWILGALLASGMAALGWSLFAAFVDIPVRNWKVPLTEHASFSALGDVGGALPFVPVTPCRVVDTRNAIGSPVPLTVVNLESGTLANVGELNNGAAWAKKSLDPSGSGIRN